MSRAQLALAAAVSVSVACTGGPGGWALGGELRLPERVLDHAGQVAAYGIDLALQPGAMDGADGASLDFGLVAELRPACAPGATGTYDFRLTLTDENGSVLAESSVPVRPGGLDYLTIDYAPAAMATCPAATACSAQLRAVLTLVGVPDAAAPEAIVRPVVHAYWEGQRGAEPPAGAAVDLVVTDESGGTLGEVHDGTRVGALRAVSRSAAAPAGACGRSSAPERGALRRVPVQLASAYR